MAETWFNDGSPRKAKEVYFNDGAVRKIKEAWFNDGTGVRKVYTSSAVVNPLPTQIVITQTSSGSVTVSVRFRTDGSVTGSAASVNVAPWFDPITASIGSAYWIRVSADDGGGTAGLGGDTRETWLQLNTDRVFSLTSGINRYRDIKYEIATDSSGGNAIAGRLVLEVDN